MPKRALTMGVGTILEAKRILLLATGESKADILAKAVEGPVTAMVSASALQLHEDCVVIVDEAAGNLLQEKEYYNWIFDNEPEWSRQYDRPLGVSSIAYVVRGAGVNIINFHGAAVHVHRGADANAGR